jgi:hypothetical protein
MTMMIQFRSIELLIINVLVQRRKANYRGSTGPYKKIYQTTTQKRKHKKQR